jgi:hypothetical protein
VASLAEATGGDRYHETSELELYFQEIPARPVPIGGGIGEPVVKSIKTYRSSTVALREPANLPHLIEKIGRAAGI